MAWTLAAAPQGVLKDTWHCISSDLCDLAGHQGGKLTFCCKLVVHLTVFTYVLGKFQERGHR